MYKDLYKVLEDDLAYKLNVREKHIEWTRFNMIYKYSNGNIVVCGGLA